MKNCNDCKFAFDFQSQKVCRRFPPSVLPTARSNPLTRQQEMGIMSVWPTVTDGPGCGEYAARETKIDDDKARSALLTNLAKKGLMS